MNQPTLSKCRSMPISTKFFQWLLDDDFRVATRLGFLSIPLTVAVSLSTGPSHYDAGPVVLAGFLAGLYYSSRSTSTMRAGFRIGIIGSVPTVWASASFIASGWAISPRYAILGVAFSLVWHLFTILGLGFFSAVGALVGNAFGRIPPFRRIGPKTA